MHQYPISIVDTRQNKMLKKSKKFNLEMASMNTEPKPIEYTLDLYLPKGIVVGSYGRGGTAKSSFIATLLASVSTHCSSLWISSEEQADWINVRHIKSGGKEHTLITPTVEVTEEERDADGRPIASSFDVYSDLEHVIDLSINKFAHLDSPPLRVVVLDAIVALVNWKAGESPNTDQHVKRLLKYLEDVARKYELTIWLIGHANKGQGKNPADELSDGVMGARAWVDSPRLSFMHFEDKNESYNYVVYSVKTNLGACFAQDYSTEPVFTLYKRQGYNDSVLCKAVAGDIVWGRGEGRERVMEAITVEKDGDENKPNLNKKQQSVQEITVAIQELLQASATTTRKQVEGKLGRVINLRHWKDADVELASVWKINIKPGSHGELMYFRSEN